MITEYNEKTFIEAFTPTLYMEIIHRAFAEMQKLPEYKSKEPMCASMMVLSVKAADGRTKSILVECTAHRLPGGVVDFGIIKLGVSDEDMPDEALDRFNEYKSNAATDKPKAVKRAKKAVN
jgi:hypothetical protein